MRFSQPHLLTFSLLLCTFSCTGNSAPATPGAGGVSTSSTGTNTGSTMPTSTNAFVLMGSWGTTLVGPTWNNTDTNLRALADFDGDGLSDLLAFSPNDFYFAKNISTTFAAPASLRDDFTAAAGWTSQNATPLLFGDVNGDKKMDIVGLGQSEVFCNVSDGATTTGEASFNASLFTASVGYVAQETTPRFLGDVNGDGLADLVGINPNGVFVGLSQGTAFGPPTQWSNDFTIAANWTSQNVTPRMLADVNGDGKDDLVGFGPTGVMVAASNGERFAMALQVSTEFVGAAWPNNDTHPRFAADINGDGMADFVGIDNTGVHVALGTGAQSAEPSYIAYVGFEPSTGWTSQVQTPRLVADINGDKKADIVGFSGTALTVVLAP